MSCDNNPTSRNPLLFKTAIPERQSDTSSIEMYSYRQSPKISSAKNSEVTESLGVAKQKRDNDRTNKGRKRTTAIVKTLLKDSGPYMGVLDENTDNSRLNSKQNIGKYIPNNNENKKGDLNYDIWDLTYTMISSQIPTGVLVFFFTLFVAIRYYTFACLIYITSLTDGKNVLWVLVVVANRVVYMILVIKISLKIPQTRTEIVLKSHWNSQESSVNEYFEVTDTKKLLVSILRGVIPAELAFIYIKATPKKRFILYTAINYVNSSIEAILYYPFFIAYGSILVLYGNEFGLSIYYKNSTLGLVVFAQLVILVLTGILVVVGIKRKYGRVWYCLW